MSAVVAAQQGTANAVYGQYTATAGAIATSVAATGTRGAELVATGQAATAEAGTATAQAMSTKEIRDGMLTAVAVTAEAPARLAQAYGTVTRVHQLADQDEARETRKAVWGWLGLSAATGIVAVTLYTIYSFAALRVNESRIIRNARTGEPVAYRHRDGLEYLEPPVALPALAAPDEEYEPPSIVRVNGARRETLYHYDDDTPLHWRDMHVVLSQEQIRQLRRWYGEGHRRLRRDSSSAGPGVDQIGLGSGSVYNTLRAVLTGLEYITGDGEWTPRGLAELLAVVPSSSSPSRLLDGDGAVG